MIKELATEIFGDCKIYIFGSRALLNKKGGDVDIFVIPKNKDNLFKKKIRFSSKLENVLRKPVDVIVSRDLTRAIEEEAIKGVEI